MGRPMAAVTWRRNLEGAAALHAPLPLHHASSAMQGSSGFVCVSRDRMRFEAAGRPFFFAGCNCYYLLVRAAALGGACKLVQGGACSAVHMVHKRRKR